MRCPLCNDTDITDFHDDGHRPYRRCRRCLLVFVPPAWHLGAAEEKAEYDRHVNRVDDPGYRRFLSRLATPLLERVAPTARGLDFGCGPGPALAAMLREAGLEVDLYDPYYAPNPAALATSYDFVTATEVIEHLRAPAHALERLWALLSPGGWLALMTKLVIDRERFTRWHYTRDQTHIAFFSRPTMTWLGARWQAEPVFAADDVILFRKPA